MNNKVEQRFGKTSIDGDGSISQGNIYMTTEIIDKKKKYFDFPTIAPGRLVNRECLKNEVIDKLSASGGLPIYVIGKVGTGKSFFMNVFCENEKQKGCFDAILYIRCGNNTQDIRDDLMKIGNEHEDNYADDNEWFKYEVGSDIDANWRRYKKHLNYFDQVLIVIVGVDSIEKIEAAERYISELRCSVVITSSKIDVSNSLFENIRVDNRIIEFPKLKLNYCVDLFLQIFCNNLDSKIRECKESYTAEIERIVKALNYHSQLIIIAAQTMREQGYVKPRDLKECCSKLIDGMEMDPTEHVARFIADMNFEKESLDVLYIMSLLSPKPVPLTALEKWSVGIVTDIHLTIKSLVSSGWIEQTEKRDSTDKKEIVSFHMHQLIVEAFRKSKPNIQEELTDKLLSNLADFLFLPIIGGDCSRITPYFDNMQSILRNLPENFSSAMYRFKRNYIFFLLRSELDPNMGDFVFCFKDNFRKYKAETTCKEAERWLDICFLWDTAYVKYSKEEDKYIKRQKLCEEMLQYAKENFAEDDYWYIRAEFKNIRANAHAEDGDYSRILDAINLLKNLGRKTEASVVGARPIEVDYILFQIYQAIIDYYCRLILVTTEQAEKKEYVDAAGDIYSVLAQMQDKLKEYDAYKRSIQNTLGTYLLYKSETYDNQSLLKKALGYFQLSYDFACKNYGPESVTAIKSLYSISRVLRMNGDYDKAVENLEYLIKVGIDTYGDEKHKVFWKAHWELAKNYYEKYLKSNELKEKSKKNYLKAKSICDFLYDEPEKYQIEYQALISDFENIF